MVDIDEQDLVEEESTPTPTEAKDTPKKDITQEVNEFKERKVKAQEEIKKIKAEKKAVEKKEKKQESKKESTTVEKKEKPTVAPEEDFLAKSNTVKLDSFIARLKKDFEVEIVPTKNNPNEFNLLFDELWVCGLMPRNKCWYSVWREVAEEDNKRKSCRVLNEKDEQTHYDYIKEFVRLNSTA